jgi:uncharacterized membrane protein
MSKKSFNFCDVLGYGWGVMASNLWFFVGLGFLYLLIVVSPGICRGIIGRSGASEPFRTISSISLQIIGQLISIVLSIGLLKIALSFCDEQKPGIVTLFDGFDCFWRYLGVAVLYILIVVGGFLLLIVPGIIWAVKFSLCYYFVVDKGLGPIEALKASSRTTKGVKWDLFGFDIFTILIIYAGFLCLGVGVFAAYPTVLVAKTLVYRQLSAQTPDEY